MSEQLWGIDLGGTKIEGLVLKSAADPAVVFRDRIATEGEKGYDHIVSQIRRMTDMMEKSAGHRPAKLGIATPGTLDPQLGVMKNSNSTSLNGKPLKADLEDKLGMRVSMANDANCFALAEAKMGVVKERFPGAEVVFGVIMGTGVGGGVVVNGKVINGLQGIGGEWGHNFLDDSGGPCYCGKSGCVENVLSGPALEKYYFSRAGVRKSLKEIMTSIESDPIAQETHQRLIRFFGRALSVIINILDPQVIVIGGGVGNVPSLYTQGRDEVRKHVFNNRLETPIVKPSLGDSAGVFGAAYLVA
jgi:predicted NBD/HSP70 family sugar kinase